MFERIQYACMFLLKWCFLTFEFGCVQHNPKEVERHFGKMLHNRDEISVECKHRCRSHVCVVACWNLLMNLRMPAAHGRSDSQTCVCLTGRLCKNIKLCDRLFCSVSVFIPWKCVWVYSACSCAPVDRLKRPFLRRTRLAALINVADREATLGVLIKPCYNSERSGVDERGGWRRRNQWGTRQREWAPLSPLLSALLIPVILFDGIRFINN